MEHGGWRTVLWTGLTGLLAAVLLIRAVDTHRANVALHRQCVQEESRLERLAIEADRLRQERRALTEDPLYIDAVQRWSSPGAPERR